ncbi:hypothetical protein NP493_182g00000 [Ridgeia piscesae]|uniref:Uncharacterized protein n=1 Tax=Ridgeia piscesae TaxID=27915 RepID=A0AAD9P2L4_RIDPI|nr:hypothetical protein NP493_182g00000 [Ridgeia piscesae]
MQCSDENVQFTVTDAGICCTFNARINATNSMVNATGVKNGLELVLNVEQYQYRTGPHNAVGLKLLLYRQDDVPLVQDFGDNIPVGKHTFVAITLMNIRKCSFLFVHFCVCQPLPI